MLIKLKSVLLGEEGTQHNIPVHSGDPQEG